MNKSVPLLASIVPLLTLAACNPAPVSTAAAGPSPSVAPSVAPTANVGAAKATVVIAGLAKAPLDHVGRIIPVGGGNVIPVGGGNVIPVGGGNVVPVGGGHVLDGLRRVLGLDQAPLANATVYLADAAGQAYPGLPSATTDATGHFSFPDVPAGYTYMVVAAAKDQGRGKDVTLQTLVRATDLGATTTLDTASSLVTLAVTEGQSELGNFNASTFRTATEATAKQLQAGQLPDLSDRSAMLAKIDDLSKQVAELKQAIDAIRQQLQDIQDKLDDIDKKLSTPSPTPTPTPTPTPILTPPPQQPMQPPPPNGGGGTCMPTLHQFQLNGSHTAYPLVVHVYAPNTHNPIPIPGSQTGITFRFTSAAAVDGYMPACPADLELTDDSGTVVANARGYIPPGGQTLTLPF